MNHLVLSLIILLTATSLASNTWSSTGAMTIPRSGHRAVLLPDGKVLAIGGSTVEFNYYFDEFLQDWVYESTPAIVASCELYDPATGQWTATGFMNEARTEFTATTLPNGKVLVTGGANDTYGSLASSELYDPNTGTWSTLSWMTGLNRNQHTATLMNSGKVLICGGGIWEADLFDPATNLWSASGSISASYYDHSSTLLADGRVLAAGGTGRADNSCRIYDPTDGSWTLTGPLSGYRTGHCASRLNDGRVIVVGGRRSNGTGTATTEIYNPVVGSWSAGPDFPSTANSYPEATPLANGKILVTDHYYGSYLFDPTSNSWSARQDYVTPLSRENHAAVLLASGKVLICGGGYPEYEISNTEIFDPGTISLSAYQQAASLAGLTGNDALPGAIPFHDGIPNLLKFSFGLNLSGPDVRRMPSGGTVGLPAAYLHDNGGTVFRVEFLRRKNSGLTYTPKKSTTLVNGSFIPLTGTPVVSNVGDGSIWERVTVDEPYDPATTPKLFTVVEVTNP